jgi:hypothetical protein
MASEGMSGQGLTIPYGGSASSTSGTSVTFHRGTLRYDNPFLDMTSTFIPRTIKGIFRFIAVYVIGDPLVSQCIIKLSEYPITKLIYNDENGTSIKDDKTLEYWKNFLEDKLKILKSLIQAGMDYYAYGNSIISIHYPFKRMLRCPRCRKDHAVEALKCRFRNYKFYAKCMAKGPDGKPCGYDGEMDARDISTKEINKFRIVHWDLLQMDIKYNPITGDHFYFYSVPGDLAAAIRRGDMDIVNGTRLEVIDAIRKRKQLKLMADNVFHLKRPGPQYIIPSERGWGIPAVFPVLKDVFHIKILKKGNEMIAFDHIVPLRMLFPVGTGDVSPHATINLSSWKTKIEDEIRKWRSDPNYITILPLPVGMQNMSGDAKMLMVTPEIRATEDTILIGIGMIPEIIRGGASWSGSNVSLRVVENSFLNHRSDMHMMLDFIIKNICEYMNKPVVQCKMSDFKMADDLQKKQMMVNLAMGPKSDSLVSATTMVKELGLDPDSEFKTKTEELNKMIELRVREAEGTAEANGTAGVVAAMYQADAQIENQNRLEMRTRESQMSRDKKMEGFKEENSQAVTDEVGMKAQEGGQDPATISIPNLILNLTNRFTRLSKVDPDEFKLRMLSMKNSTPNLYQEVYNNLKEMNLIAADVMPDLAMAQAYTPGSIPATEQGGMTAEQPPSPVELGADTIAATPMIDNVQSMPEQRPPRSATSPI